MIREHGTLEKVVEHIRADTKQRYAIPDDWPFQDARQLFLEPGVRAADDAACDFRWEAPDVDGLVTFLVRDKGFSEDRVRSGAARLQKNLKSAQQARLEGFFRPLPKTADEKAALKRKAEHAVEEKKKKAKAEQKAKREAKAKPRGTA